VPTVLVDPASKCLAVLLFGDTLALVPLRQVQYAVNCQP
jgi:hypothetical protein